MKRWTATSLEPLCTEDCGGDIKSHDYEEISFLQTPQMQPPVNGYLEAVHRKTAPTIPAVIPAVKTAVEVAHGTHRHFRRANPLYDITSFTVKSRDSNHVTPTSACPPRCLLILVAISIVLATAAVVMATLAIAVSFAENDGVSSELNRTRERVDTMMVHQLSHDDVRGQRVQGPPVTWNMSACIHSLKNTGSSIDSTETRTEVLDLTKPGDYYNWVITGVTCSTIGGTQAMLVVNEPQYECVCRGNTLSSITGGSRYCILHFWVCPPTL